MAALLSQQIQREFALQKGALQGLMQASLFFVMLMVFFPMALPFSPSLYREVLPGILWVSLTFSIFLSATQLFIHDVECGYLAQCLCFHRSLSTYVYAKLLVHGGAIITAILLVCPLISVLYNLNLSEYLSLNFAIIAIAPAVLILCTLIASFSAYRQKQSLLLLLVLFPLILPCLIIGSLGLSAAIRGEVFLPYLAVGLALSLLLAITVPFATAAMLKAGIEIAE